jgi:photosystem II stability/assembly factor-like uncharacterized protein
MSLSSIPTPIVQLLFSMLFNARMNSMDLIITLWSGSIRARGAHSMASIKLILLTCLLAWLSTNALRAQWVQTSGPNGVSVLTQAASSASLFAGTTGGVYLSTNNGANWTAVNSGLTNLYVTSLAVSGTNIFAGTHGGIFGVSLSPNSPTIWTAVNNGLPSNALVTSIVVSGANVFAGTTTGGIFLSTNSGASWTPVNRGLTSAFIYALAVAGTSVFAGTKAGGIFRTADYGAHWTAINSGLTNLNVISLTFFGTNLFAGTLGAGLFFSADSGTTWTSFKGLPNLFCLVSDGTNFFGGTSVGVFLSTDKGSSWTAMNTGMTDTTVYSLAIVGANLFAGTDSSGVWSRPMLEMTTAVETSSSSAPLQYRLEQNYPNPFNPATTISYVLPVRSSVQLQVFNLLGQLIAELVRDEQNVGFHSVVWKANVPSGIYFYRIQAAAIDKPSDHFEEVKKLILLK